MMTAALISGSSVDGFGESVEDCTLSALLLAPELLAIMVEKGDIESCFFGGPATTRDPLFLDLHSYCFVLVKIWKVGIMF